MTRQLPAGVAADFALGATTYCFCWLITRQDGTVMAFTEHDQPLDCDGNTYAASTSFTASAIENQLGFAVSNMDVLGALSSDVITNDDLEAGRYDGADVTILHVNWANPANFYVIVSGTLGQVQLGDLAFQAELRCLAQHYAQYVGSLCSPKCRSDLFDTGAGLENGCNLARPAPVTGTIAAITDRTSFQVSAVGSFPDGTKGSLSGGYFAFGTCKFTSGENLNIVKEITTSDSSLNIVVKEPYPLDIQVGDAVELQIGCDKTPETCATNYANIDNFRGEPYVPGTDMVFKVNGE